MKKQIFELLPDAVRLSATLDILRYENAYLLKDQARLHASYEAKKEDFELVQRRLGQMQHVIDRQAAEITDLRKRLGKAD
ncbi:hypothetical protein [Breoghania sp. L-A4]|uniref:hypothetical protein n=1 Tax=Breoghania sp. L-A4 TaxID=2304600 RepID=UPI000E359955|nr:hypothetical protein [Breoghania sp. L-A4]AXS39864.1 hypothetical protein D1F64_07115 [Breoghania sp. L-A4]